MTDSQPFSLTAAPIKPSDIPSEASIVAAGRELLEATASWKTGKTHFNVKTVSRAATSRDIANWHCRISEHPPADATFDEFWDKLAKNKAENESQYIPMLTKIRKVKELSPTAEVWSLYNNMPWPLSDRVFTVLQVIHREDTALPSGIIVSIPIDLSSDDELQKLAHKGTKGSYVSVERIMQLDNGNIEWRMATSSDAGGLLPKMIVDRSIPKVISEDVPHFLLWIKSFTKSS